MLPDDDFELDDGFLNIFRSDDSDGDLGWNFWIGDDDRDDGFDWLGGTNDEPTMAKDLNNLKTVPNIAEELNLIKDDDIVEDIDRVLDSMYFNIKSWLHAVNAGGRKNGKAKKQLKRLDNVVNAVNNKISSEFLHLPVQEQNLLNSASLMKKHFDDKK